MTVGSSISKPSFSDTVLKALRAWDSGTCIDLLDFELKRKGRSNRSILT